MATEGSATVLRPRKATHRPPTWFASSSSSASASTLAPTSKPAGPLFGISGVKTPTEQLTINPFHAPPTSFRSPHSSLKGKHKLSPSPSPRNGDYDFVISSPRVPLGSLTPNRADSHTESSSPVADSPTPALGVATAAAKVRLVDDDSPIRHVPGHSRSLAAARVQSSDDLFSPAPKSRSPTPRHPALLMDDDGEPLAPFQPLFPYMRASQSQDCNAVKSQRSRIPRLSTSHPIRPRGNPERPAGLSQKKALSLGEIQVDKVDDSPFGAAFIHARKPRSSMGPAPPSFTSRPHRRTIGENSISRSAGHKSGLSLSLSQGFPPMPDFGGSNTSISACSSTSSTSTPISADAMFENIKPNPEVFEAAASGIKQKFKPRESNAEEDRAMMPPPSVVRQGTAGPAVKRARSLGNRPVRETGEPVEPSTTDLASKFDFVVEGVSAFGFGAHAEDKLTMPGTPVKRHAFAHPHSSGRIQLSVSQPVLGSNAVAPVSTFDSSVSALVVPASSVRRPSVPQLTVTTTSSPDSGMDTEEPSPTVHLGSVPKPLGDSTRLGLLRRISGMSEASEDEVTPTKGSGARTVLALANDGNTPTPSPSPKARLIPLSHSQKEGLVPRLSLPTFGSTPNSRRLSHRQSHPAAPVQPAAEADIFESRFITMQPLGKGAFSSVLQVQERNGDGVFAVKRTRGVFDGAMNRLRHLEEVEILRYLSKEPCNNVIRFIDAWEQNRQLYIQTEACVGSLAAFLEVFGQETERLDEGRVWKMVRDLSEGIHHIHSHGVIHFDIKPDNILVAADRSLKIADFGMATRWPRISPAEILAGSGLGGSIGACHEEKLEREGDRVYMPAEMLRGVFVMAADIFSFGLVILESAMNIYLPDGGPSWHALRDNNFGWLDLSPLSPALSDLIVRCLHADPDSRPTIQHIVDHPVVQRSRSGGAALAPEDPRWIVDVLAGGNGWPAEIANNTTVDSEGDIVMEEE